MRELTSSIKEEAERNVRRMTLYAEDDDLKKRLDKRRKVRKSFTRFVKKN